MEDVNVMGYIVNGEYEWVRDDSTMLVTYADGSTRPYTPEEIVAKEERAVVAAEETEVSLAREQIAAAMTDIDAEIINMTTIIDATDESINSDPAVAIKAVSTALRRSLQTLKNVARLSR